MKRAIREHAKEAIAILALIVFAMATTGYILANQQAPYPSWIPFLGEETFELKADLETAQAITPGQGQTVNVAGIKVGDITEVELEDGHAVVTMLMEDRYEGLIKDDATVLVRPRTGLQDMTLEVDPGSPDAAAMEEGDMVPLASTQRNVPPDEFLAALDGDTRDYLKLLVQGGSEGLAENGEEASAVFRRFAPLSRYLAKLNGALSKRADAIKRSITSFKQVSEALGGSDTRLAEFVSASNDVLSAFARQEASLRATFQELPSALTATREAVISGDAFAQELGPAATALLPSAKALKPALQETYPFFRDTEEPIREQITPFARNTQDTFEELRKTTTKLSDATPTVVGGLSELNRVFNSLGYNPPGAEEGYLFWANWLGHNAQQTSNIQDANGALIRAIAFNSCQTASLALGTAGSFPSLKTLIEATRIPSAAATCAIDPQFRK
ncbi:MAG: phospholipid/cholesterol/gamma-HCH transport system substrate-binding protein [Solirubrobacterales bacterium]|nr:phospholipid/cholesterol/gamma-HCH transport system substrate-binding protein [Solirubrobacterales bacterium]